MNTSLHNPSHNHSIAHLFFMSPFLLLIFLANALAANAADPKGVDPQNSKTNSRIESQAELTAQDQGNSQRDVTLTAEIRKAVMAAPNLSVDAQNIKIISQNGRVTLKGPVKSASEKQKLESLAVAKAGRSKVSNQLEIEQ